MKIVIQTDCLRIMNNHSYLVRNNGAKITYKENMYHNIDGPACEWNDGGETWWSDGKLHKKYGPARKWNDSYEWYFNDEEYIQEEFMEEFL